MERPKSGAGQSTERKGPQGTQIFSQNELDRLIAASVTDAGARPAVSLRGASESVAGRVIALEGDRLLIGRAAHCDLVINEASISNEHARLSRESDGWRIANLLSTNGTFVNGKRATRALLRHGDHIRVGRIDFVFEAPDQPGRPSATRWRLPLLSGLLLLTVAGAIWLLAR